MKAKTSLLILSLSLVPLSVVADECIVDEIMRQKRVAMDTRSAGAYDENVVQRAQGILDQLPDMRTLTCADQFDRLNEMVSGAFSGPFSSAVSSQVMAELKRRGCSEVDRAVRQAMNKPSINVPDPFGVFDGRGVTTETGVISPREAIQRTRRATEIVRQLPSGLPDRDATRAGRAIGGGVLDAVNGL